MKHLIKNKYIWIFATYILIMTVVPRGLKFVLYLGDVGKTEHLAFKNYHVENDLLIIWLNISIQLLILGFVFFLYSSTSVFTWKRPIVKGKDFLNALYIFLWKILVSGIAGIVLTLGMAVDANVLIFERIKEELRAGRSVMSAIDSGYSRAMASITDSNLTTLIAAVILFSFGTGPIKGFAVTMSIGIVTSFFSAISVTRWMVVTWMHAKKPKTIAV